MMVGSTSKKKPAGLGRGLESLLEDNSPIVSGKPTVIRRGDAEDERRRRAETDNLYKKEGAMSYVKTVKRSGS